MTLTLTVTTLAWPLLFQWPRTLHQHPRKRIIWYLHHQNRNSTNWDMLLFVLVWCVCRHFENTCKKSPPPKCDVIIQKCWLGCQKCKNLSYLFFTGYKSISSWLSDEYNISHSASRITLSCRGMQIKFLTELKCCIFTFVCKINHDWSQLYCVVWFQMK